MNGPMSIQRLQGAQTMDYFSEILTTGGAGDAHFITSHLRKGRFSAIVPPNTNAQRVIRFSEGGLLTATGPAHVIGKTSVQAVPQTISAVSEIIAKRIRLLEDPVLWVHEPMLLEAEIKSPHARCRTIEGQLYLVYEDDIQTEARIAEVMRYSSLSWHFLAFLTNQVHQARSVPELVEQAQMILVGAYDGESMLLWERG